MDKEGGWRLLSLLLLPFYFVIPARRATEVVIYMKHSYSSLSVPSLAGYSSFFSFLLLFILEKGGRDREKEKTQVSYNASALFFLFLPPCLL